MFILKIPRFYFTRNSSKREFQFGNFEFFFGEKLFGKCKFGKRGKNAKFSLFCIINTLELDDKMIKV